MKSVTVIPFDEVVYPSEPGKTIGDLLNEALTTGLYPAADSSVISGFDEDFDSNDLDSWYVDPLNRFGSGVGDLLQSGALHRSSLTEVQAPSAVSPQDVPDEAPAGMPVEAAQAASES